jgi:uncharacterized membrane protein YcaP (DUF421 family)
MFELDLPWWEFIARAAIVYLALLVMVRLSGKRTVGQFTPFDLLVVMLLSESVSASLSGGDDSVGGALILAATLVLLNLGIAFATARSHGLRKVIEGDPILVGSDGAVFEATLKRHHVAVADVEQALREADCELKDMRCAILEADGKISILKKGT